MNRKSTSTRASVARRPGTKLAASVADLIVADIARLDWPEGEVLGSEPDLLARYGVSRAVLREAVRLVEHQQVARMRRGPGGGLVVTAPTLEAVIDPVAVYLFYENTEVYHVAEARIALEETAAELAIARLTAADVAALDELAERERSGTTVDHRELHMLLASITRNPAIELFTSLLTRLMYLYFPDVTQVRRSTITATHDAHIGIILAVMARDVERARRRVRGHLEAEAEYLRSRRRSGQRLDASVLRALDGSSKRGERLARDIFVTVAESGWPVGELLGSEADMMERYGVSRAVLREGVRVLEHHQVAVMRRGPGGGLFVAQPGVESATGALALLLERRRIEPGHLFELRTAVEVAILELAVKRLTDERADALREALDVEQRAPEEQVPVVGHDVHAVLATLADNPVFELLSLVLIQLTRMHQAQAPGLGPPLRGDVHKAHAAIVKAVTDRDIDLARSRMRRHLRALRVWVQ